VAWPSGRGTYDYDTYFAAMSAAGENFARVWMCPWSMGIEDAPGTLTNYAMLPAWHLDYALQLAEQKGIYLQTTLTYHGMFETEPDYWGGNNYWTKNPYNTVNGGPCVNQNAFFTNTTAQTLYQKRLRYLVARYGYSPNLLSWEFFNEIDNEYAYLSSTSVALWHRAMGKWLQTNEVFGHLRTSSFTYASLRSEVWSLTQIDYTCEHAYTMTASPLAIAIDSQAFLKKYKKPILIAEFGTDWRGWNYNNCDPYLRGYRQGIWSGALGGSAGTSMSWNWDSLPDYSVCSSLTTILGRTGWGRGAWTKIAFRAGQSVNAIGQRGPHESLIYLVSTNAAYPNGGTNATLPLQQALSVTLSNWPSGLFHAEWYDPSTGSLAGNTRATATGGVLILPLPAFAIDLAGIIYPPPALSATKEASSGEVQLQLVSETGGRYTIERSGDLATWTPALAMTNLTGTATLDASNWMNGEAVSFFRAVRSQ
jgi:hypothetical protein